MITVIITPIAPARAPHRWWCFAWEEAIARAAVVAESEGVRPLSLPLLTHRRRHRRGTEADEESLKDLGRARQCVQ